MISKILQIIFPNKCINCFKYTNTNSLLCNDCYNKIQIHTTFSCPKCRMPMNLWNTKIHCKNNDQYINSIFYCMDYRNKIVKEIVHQFKYRKTTSIKYTLNKIISTSLQNYKQYFNKKDFLIIPVPLHKYKQRARGFNQSEIISDIISNILNIETKNNILIRFKNNPPQANQEDSTKRKQNAENIFKINENLKHLIQNKNIILVDDVFTTGSTLNECAKILKENSAKDIYAICLAR